METNRIRKGEKVVVEIYENATKVGSYQTTDAHDIEEAIREAYRSSDRYADPMQDYVFKVTESTTGTESRYRINAHGNVKLIV